MAPSGECEWNIFSDKVTLLFHIWVWSWSIGSDFKKYGLAIVFIKILCLCESRCLLIIYKNIFKRRQISYKKLARAERLQCPSIDSWISYEAVALIQSELPYPENWRDRYRWSTFWKWSATYCTSLEQD